MGTICFELDNDTPSQPRDIIPLRYSLPGEAGAEPIIGKWSGGPIDTPGLAIARDSFWHWYLGNPSAIQPIIFGSTRDRSVPVVGDFDGDGDDDIGIMSSDGDQSNWQLDFDKDGNVDSILTFPASGSPAIGDWNEDGADNIGTYFPSTAAPDWFISLDPIRKGVHDLTKSLNFRFGSSQRLLCNP